MAMRKFVRYVFRLALTGVIIWLGWLAIVAHYYQDVTTCFEQSAECDSAIYITIHHDAIPQSQEVSLRDIDKFHSEVRKWSCGFAYNYYITANKIYKIRFDKNRGAHVFNNNSRNIGICLHGNFDFDYPTLEQQILLICLVNHLCHKYKINKSNIKIHSDWDNQSGTSCCGENFNKSGFLRYILTAKD